MADANLSSTLSFFKLQSAAPTLSFSTRNLVARRFRHFDQNLCNYGTGLIGRSRLLPRYRCRPSRGGRGVGERGGEAGDQPDDT